MSGKDPSNNAKIGIDVFKEILNSMKNELLEKMDKNASSINRRLEEQGAEIAALNEKVKAIPDLEKRISNKRKDHIQKLSKPLLKRQLKVERRGINIRTPSMKLLAKIRYK